MATSLLVNSFWADKALYDDAEKRYYENLAQLQKEKHEGVKISKCDKKGKQKKDKISAEPAEVVPDTPRLTNGNEKKSKKSKNKNANKTGDASGGGGALEQKPSLASEVAKARQHIKASLESIGSNSTNACGKGSGDSLCRSGQCGASALADALKAVQGQLQSLEKRVASLEVKCVACPPPAAKSAPAKDDDDDVDLFGSESEEDEEAERIKEQRLADYAARKSKKPALIAKSNIILDVKPWDDETDMKAIEEGVRAIQMDGLLWGASKLVPVGYGIHKLQISSVVEDDKVSVDLVQEQIEAMEDLVQSVDIAAFNKI